MKVLSTDNNIPKIAAFYLVLSVSILFLSQGRDVAFAQNNYEIIDEGLGDIVDEIDESVEFEDAFTEVGGLDEQPIGQEINTSEIAEPADVANDFVGSETEDFISQDDPTKLTDEEMIKDYDIKPSDIANDVTSGVRIEDIIEPSSEYHFSSFGRSDPFVPPLTVENDIIAGEQLIESELKSALQKYPLLTLKVVGIWQVGTKRKSLVTTPKSEGVVVEPGDFMGYRGGTVIDIKSNYLVVREFELLGDGTRKFEDVKVYLQGKKPRAAGKIVYRPGEKPEVVEPENDEGEPLGVGAPAARAAPVVEPAPVAEPAPVVEAAAAGGDDSLGLDAANTGAAKEGNAASQIAKLKEKLDKSP